MSHSSNKKAIILKKKLRDSPIALSKFYLRIRNFQTIFQFYTFTGYASFIIVLVFVGVSLWVIWIGNADFLLPMKISLVIILLMASVGATYDTWQAIKSRDLVASFYRILLTALFFISWVALISLMRSFITEPAVIKQPDLPNEMRLLISAGLALPIVFIVVSALIINTLRSDLQRVRNRLESVRSDIERMIKSMEYLETIGSAEKAPVSERS